MRTGTKYNSLCHNPLITAVLLLAIAACLPVNQSELSMLGSTNSVNQNSTNNISNVDLSSNSATDGAKGQCLTFDTSSPDRRTCIDCYQSILSSRCPGKTSPNNCIDPSIRENFTNLVNQCITQTIVSGFTCSRTVCPPGQVLNPRKCSCIAGPIIGSNSTTNSSSGIQIDVGRENWGPPVAQLNYPNTKYEIKTAFNDGSCSSTKTDLKFKVAFRGETSLRKDPINVTVSPNCSSYLKASIPSTITGKGNYQGSISINTSDVNSSTYFESFEDVTFKSAWDKDKLTNYYNDTNYGHYLGPFSGNETVTIDPSVKLNTPSTNAYLSFDLLILDSWDGYSEIPSKDGPDYFFVESDEDSPNVYMKYFFKRFGGYSQLNGLNTNEDSLLNLLSPLMQTELNPKDTGWGTKLVDALYHVILKVDATKPIRFGANLLSNINDVSTSSVLSDESWGIDNVELFTPGTSHRCGITYTFTDSNQQSSNYCLELKLVNTIDDCYMDLFSDNTRPYWRFLRKSDPLDRCGE